MKERAMGFYSFFIILIIIYLTCIIYRQVLYVICTIFTYGIIFIVGYYILCIQYSYILYITHIHWYCILYNICCPIARNPFFKLVKIGMLSEFTYLPEIIPIDFQLMIHVHTEHMTVEEIAIFLLVSLLFFHSNGGLNFYFSSSVKV